MNQPVQPSLSSKQRCGLTTLIDRWGQWVSAHNAHLETSADLLLGSALAVQWTTSDQTISAALGAAWLILRLIISRVSSAHLNWALVFILLLNLRGIVFQEGTQPASHMDYIIIISAFVAGLRRTLSSWRNSLIAIAVGAAIGILFSINPLLHSLQAITTGSADAPGWQGQQWGGQYFRAGELSVNQTALLSGVSLCACLPMAARAQGFAKIALSLLSATLGIAIFGTGSRMALILPTILITASLWWTHNPKANRVRWRRETASSTTKIHHLKSPGRRPFIALAGLASGIFTAALLTNAGRQFWQAYVGRKLPGDAERLKVLTCYSKLPFSGEGRWLYGVGYGEAHRRFCDEDVGITVTHAHNFFAQVMAESGLLSSAAIVAAASIISGRLITWLRPEATNEVDDKNLLTMAGPALLACSFFLFLFNLFELGLIKVTVLELLFGYLPASAFWMSSSSRNTPSH